MTGNDFRPFSDQALPGGGLATELLVEALKSQNRTVDLTWLAWDAGFEASARGEFAGTLPYYRTAEREETHLYSSPIYSIDRLLFYRSDRLNPPADLAAIEGQRVCLPVGYAIPPALAPLIDAERIDFMQPLDMTRCFELLALGQTEYVVNHPLQGFDLVRQTRDLSPDNVTVSDFILERNELHIIISKAAADAEAILATVNAGLAAIRENGVYDRLVAKHIDLEAEPAEAPAAAEVGQGPVVLVLQDGSRLIGEITGDDTENLILSTRFGVLTVPRVQVARVETSTGAASEIAGGGQAVQGGTVSSRHLALAGSNTIGASLALRLAELFADQIEGDLVEWRIDGPDSRTALFEGGGPGSLQAIAIEARGSSTGFQALIDGTADLAMASRPIRPEEAAALADQGDMLSPNAEHVLGLDGIAVIVHPDNPLISLTTEQIRAIFNGEIGNWSELTVPGIVLPDAPIEVLARDTRSGTFDTFASLILGDPEALRADAERFTSNPELADQVAIRPNAIGFAGLGHVRNSRALVIDECGIMLPARPFAIKSEEYPLARRLYLYRPPASVNPWSGPLIELAGSAAGQALVAQEGFINLDIASQDEETAAAYFTRLDRFQAQIPATLDSIRKVTNGAERLTTTFRFRTASAQLDARALRDLRRLAAYIRNAGIDPARVILAGFADGRGGYDSNMILSQARAQAVAEALAAEGLEVGEVQGFSEEMPVACDTDERGWQLNRRVEVWLKP